VSGHQPFNELTKHFTPEQWRLAEEKKAEMLAEAASFDAERRRARLRKPRQTPPSPRKEKAVR